MKATESVVDWAAVASEAWPTVLIGNGLSRRFSKKFAYASLMAEAAKPMGSGKSLTIEDLALFDALETADFETVLLGLTTGRRVLDALGMDSRPLATRYESVKNALIHVVQRIHPDQGPYLSMLGRLRDALTEFSFVYTTNYDLWLYWAVMQEPNGFNDYFRSESCRAAGDWTCFSRVGARSLERQTNVLYLHGALHLYQMAWGQTVKYSSTENGRLLDRFQRSTSHSGPASPLFVSEGTSGQKLAAIAASEYLSFGMEHLADRGGPLVIFGHSLGDSDAHLSKTIRDWAGTTIAFGVRRRSDIATTNARLAGMFPNHRVVLFWADSHKLSDLRFPLGRLLSSSWADTMDLP